MKELKITNEDIKLLQEMKNNCLKSNVYQDKKRLLKANAITKFLVEHEKKKKLINYLKKEQEKLATGYSRSYEDDLGNMRLVNEDIFNEVSKILSKIEKE